MYIGFCCWVVGLVKSFFLFVDWIYIDDLFLFVFGYVIEYLFGYVEYWIEVGMDYCILISFGYFFESYVVCDVCVVD